VLRLTLGIVLSALALAGAEPSCSMVPGWSQKGPARMHTSENLFEYMDGNSEGYLIYGFQNMHGVSCVQGEVTLIIDISQMNDTDAAYGMFTSNRDLRAPEQKIGMGGQIVPRRAIFAKGKYFVEVAANPEGDYTAVLTAWAAALEKIVEGESTPPAMLSWFPTEGQQSLRLVPESALGVRLLKRGYVAEYAYRKGFIVLESSPEAAAATMVKWRARLGETQPAKLGEEAFQASDKYLGRLFVFRKGSNIAGFAVKGGAPDPAELSAALAAKM
jgi:hypothetical protein